MQTIKIPGGLQTRAAFEPSTFDEKRGTVDVIFTTGARGKRRSWDGPYYEELEVSDRAVDLSRLNNGASVLNAHASRSLADVIGVVESARIESGRGIATVRFSDREDVQPIRRDVQAGILRHVSVGYTVEKLEKVEEVDKIPVYRATAWTPAEISLVPLAFDDGAVVRGLESQPYEVEITERSAMKNAAPAGNSGPPAVDPQDPINETLAERQRSAEIRKIVKRAKLGDELADKLVESGATIEATRVAVLDRLAEWSDSIKTDGHFESVEARERATVMGGPGQDFQRAAVDALLMRAGIKVEKPHAAARDVSPNVLDLARICLSRAGKSPSGWFGRDSAPKLIERAQTTSDFPAILAGSLNAAIRAGYEQEPSTHRLWVRPVQVQDFRDQVRPILGSAPSLVPVGEHDEYPAGSLTDDSTSYRVTKFGRTVELTWEAWSTTICSPSCACSLPLARPLGAPRPIRFTRSSPRTRAPARRCRTASTCSIRRTGTLLPRELSTLLCSAPGARSCAR